ncbi:hypothetical protein [uncultured Mediterranean phage uvDeep-CGR2-KM19-C37]|nr:hypothetical protein [uncultured Mediterranean phage uvDeep-CGR2-KM19-C37]
MAKITPSVSAVDPRDAEIVDLKKKLAAAQATSTPAVNQGGKRIAYDWDAIEKEYREKGRLDKNGSLNRSRHLRENKLPAPTHKYRVTANGPNVIQPIEVYAVDESEAVFQLIHTNSHMGNDNAHRYRRHAEEIFD